MNMKVLRVQITLNIIIVYTFFITHCTQLADMSMTLNEVKKERLPIFQTTNVKQVQIDP